MKVFSREKKESERKETQSEQKKKQSKEEKKQAKKFKPIYPYDKKWMDKFLISATNLASLFGDEKNFDLSDCGTHLLEHLFGILRRFCCGDDGQENFDHSFEKSICLRLWLDLLHLPGYIPGRLPQDSGAKVESESDTPRKFTIWRICSMGALSFQSYLK